jgi:hypothetical protein
MSHRLPRKTKLLYGAGDIGFSLTTTILGAFFAVFLTDVVGLSPGAPGCASRELPRHLGVPCSSHLKSTASDSSRYCKLA